MLKNFVKQFKDRDILFCIFSFTIFFGVAVWFDLSELYRLQSNTWYYSLSTIIQSLAAILALGGSIFIFRMNQVSNEVGEYKKRMINFLGNIEKKKTSDYHDLSDIEVRKKYFTILDHFIAGSVDSKFFERFEKLPLSGDLQKQALGDWLSLFDKNVEKEVQIKKFLGISAKVIGITIGGCAIFLAFPEKFLSWPFLAIALWGFIVSTYYVANAILNITGSKKMKLNMNEITLHNQWIIKAPVDDVSRIMTDFEKFPEHFPKVAESMQISKREGNNLEIEAGVRSFGKRFLVKMKTQILPGKGFISDNNNPQFGTSGHEELLLSPHAQGTLIDYTYQVTIHKKWLRIVARPLLSWYSMKYWENAVIDQLKKILEKQ
jgi:hypothetical protein